MLTVLIKALNEERHIAACLESVLAATRGLDAEIILVDSLSTDRTVEIARGYPVQIVQFIERADRGCGAAVQLGYQHARGELLYVLDADMTLIPGFIEQAMGRLEADPGLAGVAGLLVDRRVLTHADARRAALARAQTADVELPELGGGGLYRRAAVEQVGYLANRWLAAFEEADLGVRLRAAGWRLLRIAQPAVEHEGHAEGNMDMLRRLWRNGRAKAGGAFLRAAWRRPWWAHAVRKQGHVFALLALHGGTALLAILVALRGGALAGLLAWLLGWLLIVAARAVQKRSLKACAWSLLFWHYDAAAVLLGFFGPHRDPREPIASRVVSRSAG